MVVEPCRKPVRVKGLCRPKRARVKVRVQKPHTHIYIYYTIYSHALERGIIGGHRRVFKSRHKHFAKNSSGVISEAQNSPYSLS